MLLGVPHYFEAAFITAFDNQARADQPLQRHADVLLGALARAAWRTSDEYRLNLKLAGVGPASRGLKAKEKIDEQICGGSWSVLNVERAGGTTVVNLKQRELLPLPRL